jgi:hypothetical protein
MKRRLTAVLCVVLAATAAISCSDDGAAGRVDLALDVGAGDLPWGPDLGTQPEASVDSAPPTDLDLHDATVTGTWTAVAAPVMHTFWGVWGSGPDDVWAVGVAGKVLHYTAGKWTDVPTGHGKDLRGVWGHGTDVWAAGTDGWILHYDGSSWTPTQVGTDTYFAVGGDSTTGEVWAVGGNGKIVHNKKGSGWVEETVAGVSEMLMGIWAHSASDVWVVGWNTTILHYDGTKWTPDQSSGTSANFEAVWGSSAQDVWIAGKEIVLRKSSTGWTVPPLTGTQGIFNNWQAVGGTSSSDVWVLGDKGLMLRYDGSSWQDRPKVNDKNIYGVSFVSASEAWAVGVSGTLLHYSVP